MEEKGLDDEFITTHLHRNAKQPKNLPASNQAIDIALRVKGQYAPEKHASLNYTIPTTPEGIDKAIAALTKELEALQAPRTVEAVSDTPTVPQGAGEGHIEAEEPIPQGAGASDIPPVATPVGVGAVVASEPSKEGEGGTPEGEA